MRSTFAREKQARRVIVGISSLVLDVGVVDEGKEGLLFLIRTDNLGESREEAKELLEEVEAMEREAHQVAFVVTDAFVWPLLSLMPAQVFIFGYRCLTDV